MHSSQNVKKEIAELEDPDFSGPDAVFTQVPISIF
jgi:hypothetical protein